MMPPHMARTRKSADENSRSVSRVLEVLEHLSVAPQPMTNAALAERLGVPTSSMYRLLQKLVELGYVEFDPAFTSYAISGRLGELGERLADAGCRSLAMRNLLLGLRDVTGYHAMAWVPHGNQVRLAAMVHGNDVENISTAPGELRPPFSTPGLAIALTYTDQHVKTIARQCRRRNIDLGRRFRTVDEIVRGLGAFRKNGYVPGYNIEADGWAMIAWPIPVPVALDPARTGAVAVGSRVNPLRREEQRVMRAAETLLATYRKAVSQDSPLPAFTERD